MMRLPEDMKQLGISGVDNETITDRSGGVRVKGFCAGLGGWAWDVQYSALKTYGWIEVFTADDFINL